jgi:hypothetical protein
MASSKNPTDGPTKKARLEKLEAIIQDRLGLDGDWFPVTSLPAFVTRLGNLQLTKFEDAFGRMVKSGCRWEALLACLTCYHTYNARQRVVRPAQYKNHLEGDVYDLSHLPEKVWEPVGRPPDRDKRNLIDANLMAAARLVKEYEGLLTALGRLNPPPTIAASHPGAEREMLDFHLASQVNADEAVPYLQKLLKWCRALLSDDSIGNFSTVESVGQLVPCVYVEAVTPKAKPARRQRLPLKPVADLLNAMSPDSRHTQGQLREALNRFERGYPRVHRALRDKIDYLHHTSSETPDGWRQLFAAEARRRSR